MHKKKKRASLVRQKKIQKIQGKFELTKFLHFSKICG